DLAGEDNQHAQEQRRPGPREPVRDALAPQGGRGERPGEEREEWNAQLAADRRGDEGERDGERARPALRGEQVEAGTRPTAPGLRCGVGHGAPLTAMAVECGGS